MARKKKKSKKKLKGDDKGIQCSWCGSRKNAIACCWGEIKVIECKRCLRIVDGPKQCIGCQGDFASKAERIKRDCPLLKSRKDN